MFISKFSAAASLIILAGCSGTTPSPPTFTELDAEATALLAAVESDIESGPTLVANLPSGSVAYQGNVALGEDIGVEVDVIGRMTVDADFANETVSIRMFNLASESDGPIDGELNGTGALNSNVVGAGFGTTIAGSLSTPDIDATFVGAIAGAVFGATGTSVEIEGDGVMTVVGEAPNPLNIVGFATTN